MISEQMNALVGYGSLAYHHMFKPTIPSTLNNGNGGYPLLPTTQLVQHALPITITSSPCPLGHALSTNYVPIDEIIEKISLRTNVATPL
jgi:hypothetical protein